jgi:hypothetical protein
LQKKIKVGTAAAAAVAVAAPAMDFPWERKGVVERYVDGGMDSEGDGVLGCIQLV